MVGIPGQSFDSLADDILMFRALNLDMIASVPISRTPPRRWSGALRPEIDPSEQAPNTEEMVYKMLALTRIVCQTRIFPAPRRLPPSTKSMDGSGTEGRCECGDA